MSLPFVPLENVPPHGMTVNVGAWAQAAAAEALGATDVSASGTLEVRRTGRDLHVTGTLHGSARGACDARAGTARASQAHRGWLWPVFATPMPV